MTPIRLADLTQLPRAAADLAVALTNNGFHNPPGLVHAMALAEEAGEFVGAVRRWLGMARRHGSHAELAAEAVDVLIVSLVTCHDLGRDVDKFASGTRLVQQAPPTPGGDPMVAALKVFRSAGTFVDALLDWRQDAGTEARLWHALAMVVDYTVVAAAAFDIDLLPTLNQKLTVIYSRGWRQT